MSGDKSAEKARGQGSGTEQTLNEAETLDGRKSIAVLQVPEAASLLTSTSGLDLPEPYNNSRFLENMSFIQRILIDHLLCAKPGPKTVDRA